MVYRLLLLDFNREKQEIKNLIFGIFRKYDMLDTRGMKLMNALRQWDVLLSVKLIFEMDDNQFEKWHHKL